jgi:hypothetical protein
MIRGLNVAVFAVVLTLPAAAMAYTSYGQQTVSKWVASDRCVQAAQKAFPDFSAEANAKRDTALKNCLASGNLPPRSLDNEPAKP